ncbi:MAG: hypothetical protein KGM99_06195, partial [Burkholderiales bacterium]|nr:hypothetical protein [Burkholderiales bacterium]
MIERLRTSIAFRSALIVLGIAVLVASVSSIVGYIYFARSEQESAIHRMRNLLSTVENTASIACYLADQNLASEVAHGLLKNGDIKRVRIASEVTTLADYSKNNPAHKSLAGIPLNKENLALEQDIGAPFNAKEIVCHIHMELDQDFIESQSSSKALFIVYQLVFQALLMAIVVIFVVLMYITRPIKTISDSLHSLSPETGNKIA